MPNSKFSTWDKLQFFLLVSLFFLPNSVFGQVYNNSQNPKSILDDQRILSDTSNKGFAEKEDDGTVQIYAINRAFEKVAIDTAIEVVHRLNTLGIWDVDLGNTGSVYQSLKALPKLSIDVDILPESFDLLKYKFENQLFYNTTRPYTRINYSAGSKKEQQVELFHSQNITPRLNITTSYRKISSIGYFKAQKNNIDNVGVHSNYFSKNKKYKTLAAILYNKLQQDENVGILSDTFLSNPQYRNSLLIPVAIGNIAGTRSPMVNYTRNLAIHFVQEYQFGKQDSSNKNNDLERLNAKSGLSIENELYAKSDRYCFVYGNPSETFVTSFLPIDSVTQDTLNIRYDNLVFGSSFALIGKIKLAQNLFKVKGGLGLEWQQLNGWNEKVRTGNNYVFGSLLNYADSTKRPLQIRANFKLFYTGLPKGNMFLDIDVSQKISDKIGFVGIKAEQYIAKASYVQQSMQLEGQTFTSRFKSMLNTSLSGYYKNSRLGLGLSYSSMLFTNYIFRSGAVFYMQSDNVIALQQIQGSKKLLWRNWESNHELLFQISSSTSPIQVPLFASRHSFAYANKIFDKKMDMQTGVELSYNVPYYNDAYNPVFQSFVPQFLERKIMIPRVMGYFNFKVKRFRASLALDQIQALIQPNNLNYIGHPGQGLLFRFGLSWIFVN